MSELTKRVLFAVPAAILFLFLTWLGGFYFVGLMILIALFIQRELSMLSDRAGFKPDDFFPYTIGLWIMLTPYLPHAFAIGLIIFLLFIGFNVLQQGGDALQALIATMFCGVYAPAGLVTMIMIRNTAVEFGGFALTVGLLLMVWGNDIFAYFGGKSFGKHPFAPRVSPNKTWEGFFSGILGAVVGLGLVYLVLPQQFPVSFWLLLPSALLISIFGPAGDLTESRIKRAANAKDASDLLPGHGGLFDRFDALILAAPAFYVYLYLLKILGYVSF